MSLAPTAEQIRKIVVRTPTWVGDAVMSLPALRELRSLLPASHITLAAPPGAADIFLQTEVADDVLIEPRGGILSTVSRARKWRRRKFDLAVLFQNSFSAAVVPLLARVPLRLGYETDHRGALLTNALPVPDWKDQRHESFYYLNIVAELERLLIGTLTTNTVEPHVVLKVSEERQRNARNLLTQSGANLNKPLAILCPGSINSRAKRWPAERYAALADQLSGAGFDVALIGSAGELPVSEDVRSRMKSQPRMLTGQTTVAEVVALISIADVLITNDTGPAHIGAALGTPTIVIFGPTNPLTTYPLSRTAEMIRHPPDCAPCMLRDCPIDHRCMTAISPEEVFERATALVAGRHVQAVG